MAPPQSLVMEEAGLLANTTGKQRDQHRSSQLWTRLFPLFTAVAAEHLRLGRVNFRSFSL
jgi:hypothetical protein